MLCLNFWTREYWMIYRGLGFLARMIQLLTHPLFPPLPATCFCLSFSVFLSVVGRRERGNGVGVEPNHMTARKHGPLQIIQYSLIELSKYIWCEKMPQHLFRDLTFYCAPCAEPTSSLIRKPYKLKLNKICMASTSPSAVHCKCWLCQVRICGTG